MTRTEGLLSENLRDYEEKLEELRKEFDHIKTRVIDKIEKKKFTCSLRNKNRDTVELF